MEFKRDDFILIRNFEDRFFLGLRDDFFKEREEIDEIIEEIEDEIEEVIEDRKLAAEELRTFADELNNETNEIELLKSQHPEWISKYLEEEGGQAIWRGVITKGFRDWCSEKGYTLGEESTSS